MSHRETGERERIRGRRSLFEARRAFGTSALALGFCVACGHAPQAQPPKTAVETTDPNVAGSQAGPAESTAPPAQVVQLTEDTEETTPSGARFKAPAGWSVESRGPTFILHGPEAGLEFAVFDSEETDPDAAVAKAWPALFPSFKRKLLLSNPGPGRDGWDESRGYSYETSPDEKLALGATALKHGKAWLAVVAALGYAPAAKHAREIGLISETFLAKGYVKENFKGKVAHTLDPERIKQLTDFVEEGRKALQIPGVALSLIQGGKVVFEGGFGVRELGKPAKVDENTLFLIASETKALTTLLLAKEVDEGRFTWETPVVDVYPSFRLGDDATTKQVQMKHLVCACTGMPRQDMEVLFNFQKTTARDAIAALARSQPTTKFGERFQYSNAMATAAGFIGGTVAYPKKEPGAAYDEAMRRSIFEPLGMNDTTFDFGAALSRNHASPHDNDLEGNEKVAPLAIDRSMIPIRPAGGAWSSVKDMSRYVLMELANGKLPNGSPLVTETNVLARRAPQVAMDDTSTYGMGLMVGNATGTPVVHHGGDTPGFHSEMFWMPEYGVGGVILTNGSLGGVIRDEFIRRVKEVLFDARPEAREDVQEAVKNVESARAKVRSRLEHPAAAPVVADLARRYENPVLGGIVVSKTGGGATFDFGVWKSSVASMRNEDGSVSLVPVDPGAVPVGFVVGRGKEKRTLTLRDAQHEYVFEEKP